MALLTASEKKILRAFWGPHYRLKFTKEGVMAAKGKSKEFGFLRSIKGAKEDVANLISRTK